MLILELGSYASVVGLPIGLAGLYFTWRAASKARVSAEQAHAESKAARAAAEQAVKLVRTFDAVVEGTAIVLGLKELQEIHRRNEPDRALDRYGELRLKLIRFKAFCPGVIGAKKALVQAAISTMGQLEETVDQNAMPTELALTRHNTILSKHIIEIGELVEELAQNV